MADPATVIGASIVGGFAILGTVSGIVLKTNKKNNKCNDPDCKSMLAETATISARNTQDIRDINKTIDERLIPKIEKTHDATLRMMIKLDKREDQFKKMFDSTIRTSVEKILKDDK